MRSSRGIYRSAPFLLLLGVVAAYGNSLAGAFQFDDYRVIVDYPTVHSLGAWWADLGQGLRPLLKLSYTLNWISGAGEIGFHLVNVALHFIAVLLVFHLVRLIFFERDEVALSAAFLFAVHPAASEAVTYISGRSMSLMTVFYLAALLVYAKASRSDDKLRLHVWSPLFFVLAVASKETALLLPFSLLLWDLCFNRPFLFRKALKRQVVHWLVFLVLASAILLNEQYWRMMMVSAHINAIQVNLLTQLNAMTYMLGQFLMPWQMNIDPELPTVTSWLQAMADLTLWTTMAAVAALCWRRHPWASFAIFWFALQLLPVHVFLPRFDIVNDRHLYLAGWPLLLPVAFLLVQFRPAVRYAALAVLAIVLAGLSIQRNLDYRSEVALWESTVWLSPGKSRVHNNLGYAYFLAGRRQEAELAYLKAIELDPDNLRARNNLDLLRPAVKKEYP